VKLQALDMGANDFLTKPFTSADLLARVRSYVQHHESVKTLKKLVARDPLSGLITRKPFDIQLTKDISRVTRHKETLAVMLVELQDAKALLDELGKARSDSLVKMMTQVLGKSIRKEDTLARLSTSVFALSLPSAHPVSVNELATRIFTALNATRIKNKGKNVSISVAVGVCAMDIGCCPALDIIYKEVNSALNEARARKSSPLFIKTLSTSAKVSSDVAPLLPVVKPAIKARSKTASALPAISIDHLLATLATGKQTLTAEEIDAGIQRLQPLLHILSAEQRKRLLK
jgi:diguanylate cyclase (GGDEF)-like protein